MRRQQASPPEQRSCSLHLDTWPLGGTGSSRPRDVNSFLQITLHSRNPTTLPLAFPLLPCGLIYAHPNLPRRLQREWKSGPTATSVARHDPLRAAPLGAHPVLAALCRAPPRLVGAEFTAEGERGRPVLAEVCLAAEVEELTTARLARRQRVCAPAQGGMECVPLSTRTCALCRLLGLEFWWCRCAIG